VFLLAPFAVGVPQAFAVSALYALLNLTFNIVCGSAAWLLGTAARAGGGVALAADRDA
jgi:hypothetical protein